ncbi:MAG: hypothetical protein M1825_006056 [Sarcosagium campestre]|nr:MAG: hypothetical protein M1825_006056 [Sarcosagium campestre]
MPLVGGQRYFTSTAVFLNEIVKLAICLTIALYDISRNLPPSTPATSLFAALYNATCTADSWKLAIPAALFTLQNSLQYVAVSNLDAATFQVTYQFKILTTALFSVAMLGRTLTPRKWSALLLLTFGIAVVQYSAFDSATLGGLRDTQSRLHFPRNFGDLLELGTVARADLTKRSATYEGIDEDMVLHHPQMKSSVGLLAVLVACTASGLAGVYFEKVLKDSSSPSLWIRNVQLSLYSLVPAFVVGVIVKDGEDIAKFGFFSGYNWVVWTAIGFQALGGVLVALCVNYADNIAKNFATSFSIVLSFLFSLFFFSFKVSALFLLGTSTVIASTFLYSSDDRTRPAPLDIARFEKTTIGGGEGRFDSRPSPLGPLKSSGLSTSRPASPMRHHSRVASGRTKLGRRED